MRNEGMTKQCRMGNDERRMGRVVEVECGGSYFWEVGMARKVVGRVTRGEDGLTQVQRRFLRKMVREPKALSELLREQQVCRATFAGWREEAAFERAFRTAAAG